MLGASAQPDMGCPGKSGSLYSPPPGQGRKKSSVDRESNNFFFRMFLFFVFLVFLLLFFPFFFFFGLGRNGPDPSATLGIRVVFPCSLGIPRYIGYLST